MRTAALVACAAVFVALLGCAGSSRLAEADSDYEVLTYTIPDEAEEIAKAIQLWAGDGDWPSVDPAATIGLYNRICDFIAPEPAARIMQIGSILFEGSNRGMALEWEFLALCALLARHGFGLEDRVYIYPHKLNVAWQSDKLAGPFVIVGDVPIRVGYGGGTSGKWPSWVELIEGVFPEAATEPRYLLPGLPANEVAELAMAVIDEAERETGKQWRYERQMARRQCIEMLLGVEFCDWTLWYIARGEERWQSFQAFVATGNYRWDHTRDRFAPRPK
jgi:hypothetical protein